jgi:hypothetical protein
MRSFSETDEKPLKNKRDRASPVSRRKGPGGASRVTHARDVMKASRFDHPSTCVFGAGSTSKGHEARTRSAVITHGAY